MPNTISSLPVVLVLAIIGAIALTVLSFIFIVPEKRKNIFGKIGDMLHNIFNFKFLIIEKILQALYILSTSACITGGVALLFGFVYYKNEWYDEVYFKWFGGYGLLLLIAGPILVRLAYEGLMMAVLLVKNVIQINNRLGAQNGAEDVFAVPSVKDTFGKGE